MRTPLLLLALLALPIAAAAQDERDPGFLAGLIEDGLSGAGRDVEIDGFRGLLFSSSQIDKLTISDDTGPWLIAEGLELDWNRSALFSRRLDVNALKAKSFQILRAPIVPESDLIESLPPAETTPFALPQLPLAIEIDAFEIASLVLGDSFAGEEIELTLSGAAQLANGEGQARLDALGLRGTTGHLKLDGSYANTTRLLSLYLDLQEDADGLVATLLSLPGTPSLELSLKGEGLIDDFTADLALITDDIERIEGQASFKTNGQTLGVSDQTQPFAQAFGLDLSGDLTAVLPPLYHDFFGPDSLLRVAGYRQEDGALALTALELQTQALDLSGDATLNAQLWPETLRLEGHLAQRDGTAVILPGAGGANLQSAALDLRFDTALADSWQLNVKVQEFAAEGVNLPELSLTGQGTLLPATSERGGLLTADLTYAAPQIALQDQALSAVLSDGISGQIQLNRTGDAPLQISRFTLASGALSAGLTGQITGDLVFDGSLDLSSSDLSQLADLVGLPLTGTLTARTDAHLDLLAQDFEVTLKGDTKALTLGLPQLDPYLAPASTLSATFARDGQGTRLTDLTLLNDALALRGDLSLSSGPIEANLNLTVQDLGLGFEGLDGKADLRLDATRSPAGEIAFDLSYTDPRIPPGAFALRGLQGENGVTDVTLRAAINEIAPYSEAFANLPYSGALRLSGQGSLSPNFETFDFGFTGQTQGLALQDARFDPLVAGRIELAGQIARRAPDSLTIDSLSLRLPALNGSARLTGTLSSLSERPHFAGRLSLDQANLAPLSALAGQSLDGRIENLSLIAVSASQEGATLLLNGQTQDLSLGQATYDPILAGEGRLNAALRFVDLSTFSLDGRIGTEHAAIEAKGTIEDFVGDLTLDASLRELSMIMPGLSGEGRLSGILTAAGQNALSFDGNITDPATQATLQLVSLPDSPAGAFPEHYTLALTANVRDLSHYAPLVGQPISGRLDNLAIAGTVSPLAGLFDLSIEGRTFALNPGQPVAATILAGEGRIRATVERRLYGGWPLLAVDTIDLRYPNFTLTGGINAQNQARYQGQLNNIGLLLPEYSGPLTLDGSAALQEGGRWTLAAALGAPGGANARLTGSAGSSGLDLNLTGTLPLAYANPFTDPTRASGTANFDLGLRGAAELRNVSGQIRLSDGRIAIPSLQSPISGLNGTISLANGTATLQNLTARAGATAESGGGAVSASGSVDLTAPFEARIDLRSLSPLLLRQSLILETEAVIEALRLRGPLAGGATVEGQVALYNTEVRVPTSGVGALGDLPNVRHLNPPSNVVQTITRAGLSAAGTATTLPERQTGAAYGLNIAITARDNIFIRGRGLDAELAGSILLSGTTADLRPVGQFSLVRGRLSILQQRFELTEGQISLGGDFNPVVLLEAQTRARTGTDVTVALSGSLSSPEVSFSSQPELPQDEVLAQLIFGRDLSAITPLQAVQLAAAVGELAGRGGGVMESLRSGAGLQDLELLQDSDGNAAVRLGKAFTDTLYTDVTVGTTDTQINLNLDLSSSVTVKTSASSAGTTSFGLFFEKDYD